MNVSIICACLPVLSRVATLTKQKLKSIAARWKQSNDQEMEDSYYLPLTTPENGTRQFAPARHFHETTICTTYKTGDAHFIVPGQIPAVHVRRDVIVS